MEDKTSLMKLKMLGLPPIKTIDDFSDETHLSKKVIWFLSQKANINYQEFRIPKKDGSDRIISQPSKDLKALQAWILRNILDKLESSSASKGFERKMTIWHNASPHIGANIVVNMDIDDFFPSITSEKVYSVFRTIGYNSLISTVLTKICTYNNSLPQGSPCSPKLSNLVCIRLDNRIQGYVGKKGITYTRYADDMSFSGLALQGVHKILRKVGTIINDEGFQLNKAKTRIAGLARAKKVTGLIITEKGAGIGGKKLKKIRGKIYRLTYSKEKQNHELLNEVEGWLAFIKSVDYDRYINLKKYIDKLQSNRRNKNKLIGKISLS